MERYWCLRWLGQEHAKQADAVVLKDEIVRLTDIPLTLRMPGMAQLARGAHVKLDLVRWDETDLSVEARILEVISQTPDTAFEVEEEDIEVPPTATIEETPADDQQNDSSE